MRRIILLGLVVLVVVLGWTGAWFYGAQLIRDEITALGADLRFKPIWIEELVTLARELLHVPAKP